MKNPNPSPIPLVHVTFLVEQRKPKNDSFSIEKVKIEIFLPYLMKLLLYNLNKDPTTSPKVIEVS